MERYDLVRHPHFALWADDAGETARAMMESGARFHDFTCTPTGLPKLFDKDPDGNMIEFIGPTKAPRGRRME